MLIRACMTSLGLLVVSNGTHTITVMGSILVESSESSENYFSEHFDLRTLLHYLHFIQVTKPFIIHFIQA